MSRTPHILIVGGGYAGFYAARGLEKRLKCSEACVTILDPRPYMTYQPFLPEVVALAIPGTAEAGLGLKHVEEAVAIRDAFLTALERRGAHVHLHTNVSSAEDGVITLSSGQRFESDLIVWTARIAPNPTVSKRTDLPVTPRGLVVVQPDLRVGTPDDPVADAWAGGDDAAVPDLARTPSPPYHHGFAIPTRERKVRVMSVWLVATLLGRDIVSLTSVQAPRREFISRGRLEGRATSGRGVHDVR